MVVALVAVARTVENARRERSREPMGQPWFSSKKQPIHVSAPTWDRSHSCRDALRRTGLRTCPLRTDRSGVLSYVIRMFEPVPCSQRRQREAEDLRASVKPQ